MFADSDKERIASVPEPLKHSSPASPQARTTVALVGGGDHAAVFMRLLNDLDSVHLAAVCSLRGTGPAARLAEEFRVYSTTDLSEVFQVPDLDLIIDMSRDVRVHAELESQKPSRVTVIGGQGSDLLWDLLVARKRGEEQERLFVELQVAYDKIRSHERQLQTSKQALERANEELETRLAEIFFTHEFFKALTSFTSVDDVCSLIVDGCNGILGAEISCVYLFEREDWTLRLAACQGRPERAFKPVVPVSETILGYAFREGMSQESDVEKSAESAGWVHDSADARSQAAVPLKSGDNVFGVMVMASSTKRQLSGPEMERLQVLGNQASLSLQNALLHGELERLSVTDRLTEMYNHGFFKQRLEEEFKRAIRFGHTMALIMIDIDNFKDFNDAFGHPRGDDVLRAVSTIIKSNVRDTDIAARYGGEEFAIVLPETDVSSATMVAERIREQIADSRFEPKGRPGPVSRTVSIGVAGFPRDARTAAKLLDAADSAMYQAKRSGKNCVRIAGQ